MKVKPGALLATTMAAAGVVISPAPLGGTPARAVSGVHLVTSIRALSPAPDGYRYAVTVRPVGGPARAATLILSTRRPAGWTAAAPACLSSADRTALACDLGDVREQETRTLNVTARPGAGGPAEMPVVARAGAANAPSVTASLDAAHPATLRLTGSRGAPAVEPPPATASPKPAGDNASQEPEPSPGAQSPAVDSSPVQSPPEQSQSVQSPPEQSPPEQSPPGQASSAQAAPGQSPPAESSSAEPAASEAGAPATWSRAARPSRPASRPASKPIRPATSAGPEPAAPHEATHLGPVGAPHEPSIPQAPVAPDLPTGAGAGAGAAAAPTPTGGAPTGGAPMGGPAVPPPGASAPAVLPQIAPKAAPGEGVSELNTLSPAGAMQAGRVSWATLIAIAVVTEAGLLWLVAGLTVLRRKRRGPGARRRSPWPLISRLIP